MYLYGNYKNKNEYRANTSNTITIKNLSFYDFENMRKKYSVKKIAAILGVSIFALYYWCNKNNIIVYRATDFEVIELYNEGFNRNQIAAKLNISWATVDKYIKNCKITD